MRWLTACLGVTLLPHLSAEASDCRTTVAATVAAAVAADELATCAVLPRSGGCHTHFLQQLASGRPSARSTALGRSATSLAAAWGDLGPPTSLQRLAMQNVRPLPAHVADSMQLEAAAHFDGQGETRSASSPARSATGGVGHFEYGEIALGAVAAGASSTLARLRGELQVPKATNATAEKFRLRSLEIAMLEENTRLRERLEAVTTRKGSQPTDDDAAQHIPADQQQPKSSKKTLVAAIVGGSVGSLVLLYVIYRIVGVFRTATDRNRDGVVDFEDVKIELEDKFLCGLGWDSVKNLAILVIFAVSGFAVLWWAGVIQPFLQQMLVYLYLACVVLSVLAVLILEAWDDIGKMQARIMNIVTNVEGFFDQGFEEFEQNVESLCCGTGGAGGPKKSAR